VAILLSCRGLSKSFGVRPLFENLSFGLFDGEHTGLIGPNGTGKSTLLRILAGLDTPDEGQVSPRRGLRVGYLSQDTTFEESPAGATVRSELEAALADLSLEDWEIDIRVEQALSESGFGDGQKAVSETSGGWRKRLAILKEAVREPDLLLLDEPTNHLDLAGVLWLEKVLLGLSFSFLVVTHDRRFLERVTNRVIELDKRYPEGHFSSVGGYADFLEHREAFFAAQESREESVRNIVRGEIEWLRKGPKARTTKQQARIDRAGELMGELDELKYRNSQRRAADIDFTSSDRQTRRLVELIKVEKSLGGRKLFGPLDLMLRPGDKLGLLGENGSGKSTLLKLISGDLQPDAGVIKRADALRVVVFDQHRSQLDMDQSLKRALCPAGEHVEYKGQRIHVYGWAARFLFRQEQLEFPLSRLSGGEQSRVLIANLMLQPADVLLLDEPTNDLDIRSLEVLEQSLKDFPGALVLVTHDRYLLDRVSGEILALDGRGHATFYADLAQWESAAERAERAKANAAPASAPAPKPAASRLSPEEAKELKRIEGKIKDAEAEVGRASASLHDPAIAADSGKLHELQKKVDEAQSKVDALFARWEELEAKR
jgi:ATP-binding cassette subfamily F protein uup